MGYLSGFNLTDTNPTIFTGYDELKTKSKITSQHNPIPGRKEGEQNQENTQPAGADLDESKDLVEAPEGTEPKKPSSGKRKILTRKDLRNAKQSGSEETDQFINK